MAALADCGSGLERDGRSGGIFQRVSVGSAAGRNWTTPKTWWPDLRLYIDPEQHAEPELEIEIEQEDR